MDVAVVASTASVLQNFWEIFWKCF